MTRETMGVRDYIPGRAGDGPSLHYECRRCGENLDGEETACPECGGPVAMYEV